jgi:predicted RNA-binding Zn-ribbon protein involved in translation (DUF1610 family)
MRGKAMTGSDALKVVRYYLSKIGRTEKQTQEIRDAKELTVQALNKTIAKNMLVVRTDKKLFYKCPDCKNIIIEADENGLRGTLSRYCSECGQALKLGDDKNE